MTDPKAEIHNPTEGTSTTADEPSGTEAATDAEAAKAADGDGDDDSDDDEDAGAVAEEDTPADAPGDWGAP